MRRRLHTTVVATAAFAFLSITVSVLPNSLFSADSDYVSSRKQRNQSSNINRDKLKFPKAENSVTTDDPAQKLVRIWTGTWSGESFGRNSPGQPQPRSPVAGTWILDLQFVDTVHNTASGTLTWNGRDAYWTYEALPNGSVVATAHDFIPDRTIQFNSSNTTLTSPLPGAGPQFHLNIEGYAGAPNPSDAFYGPRFSVDIYPDSGVVMSAGIGFSAHPYNKDNFDTAFSSGTVSGGTSICTPGQLFANVQLPEVTVSHSIPQKPWQIRYGKLALNFTTVNPPPNAICQARSNVGTLDVLGAPATFVSGILVPSGPFFLFGHSAASATLTIFKGSELGGLQSCTFFPFLGPRNNCLLNGSFDPNAYYAMWHTDGFSIGVNVLRDRGTEDFIHTPPYTFFVNLDGKGLSPRTKTIEAVVRGVEPYIHTTLINNLPLISKFTIVQDPGKVSLFVVRDGIFGTGKAGASELVTDIPRSLYYESDTNPAVILLSPDQGNYKIFVNGVATGEYLLSVSTANLPDNNIQAGTASGNIIQGNSIVYDLNLTNTSGGLGQTFNNSPTAFPPMELLLEEPGSQPGFVAALDSVLRTRDPFPVINTNTLYRGSDLHTRVQLIVSYLPLSPGGSVSAVTAEATDSANNIYPLTVEDVRKVPNTTLYQVTARLSQDLPNGIVSVRVRSHGQVTNSGALMIQK